MKRFLLLAFVLLLAFAMTGIAEEVTTATVYVKAGGGSLNLRQGQGTNTKSLGFVKHGDKVTVIEYNPDGWSKITVERTGLTGYINSAYLRDVSNQTGSEPTQTAAPATQTTIDSNALSATGYALPGEYRVDMNGDGISETIGVTLATHEDGTEVTKISVKSDNGIKGEFEAPMYTPLTLWLARLDGTNRLYALISGDQASDDYNTECFYFDGSNVFMVKFESPKPFQTGIDGYGKVEAVDGGVVTMGGWRDVLGTWWASAPYSLQDGVLKCEVKAMWRVNTDLSKADTWKDRALVTSRELPAMVYGRNVMLPKGTRLLLTAIDEINGHAHFVTSDGGAGYFICVVSNDGWAGAIGGVPEAQCFEFLHYAG